jgi:hypothetical protein
MFHSPSVTEAASPRWNIREVSACRARLSREDIATSANGGAPVGRLIRGKPSVGAPPGNRSPCAHSGGARYRPEDYPQ